MTFLGNPFSLTFKKKSIVLPTSTTQSNSIANSNNTFASNLTPEQIANELTANGTLQSDSPVNAADNTSIPEDFFLASELKLQSDENSSVFSTVGVAEDGILEILFLQDDFTSNNQTLDGTKQLIDKVYIQDLYNDTSAFILYDQNDGSVLLKDPSLANIDAFGCSASGSDLISLSQLTGDINLMQTLDKINSFGNVYDFQFKQINFGNYKNANASICSVIATSAGYLSVDKLINDEYKRKNLADKQNAECPKEYPPYDGFLVSADYLNGGWIDFDALLHTINNDQNFFNEEESFAVRTKKFKDAKRVLVNLVLNYSSSIPELNSFGKLSDFGVRVKDRTTGQEFSVSNTRNNNIGCVGNQITLEYYGRIEYVDGSSNPVVTCNPCVKIAQAPCSEQLIKFQNCSVPDPNTGMSHEISPQFRVDVSGTTQDLLNTIDPINWTTGIQNLVSPFDFTELQEKYGSDNYIANHLNVPRGFALGSGDKDAEDGFVYGGFFHSLLKENFGAGGFTDATAWNQIGNNYVGYQIDAPGGYSYSSFNFTLPGSREIWNGTTWISDSQVIPQAKSMGIAGGNSEISAVAFGASQSTYGTNGVVNKLTPSASTWVLKNDVWTNVATGNVARVSPAGTLVVGQGSSDPTNSLGTEISCENPGSYSSLLNSDGSSPAVFVISQNDANKISSFLSPVSNSAPVGPPSTIDISTIGGICFNGYTAAIDYDRNPWSLDKLQDQDMTNTFEWLSFSKTEYVAQIPPDVGGTPTEQTVSMNLGTWISDPTKNYPVKTIGTLYLGNQCAGIATGGKTAISTLGGVSPNAHLNIKYGYFGDSRYSEFNNSIVNLAYEYNGSAWIRRDNLVENVAFHAGVGDASHSLLFGGVHASVESTDFSVAFPGCEDWVELIKSFGGTWHRFGTTGLDREKRYASFATRFDDQNQNTYYKVGDKRDTVMQGLDYSTFYLALAKTPDISGNNWSTYTNDRTGHRSSIAYTSDTEETGKFNISYFMEGESWSGEAIKFEHLNNDATELPYTEREAALDDTDQVGYHTRYDISVNTNKYLPTYRPDHNANPPYSTATSATSAFPNYGYFTTKNNYQNVVDKYKYSGHPAHGGMWLWSRPTAGENLFHPENIHAEPTWFTDSCGTPQISGSWQSYDDWLNHSFKTHTGIHSVVCWGTRRDCADKYDSDVLCSDQNEEPAECGSDTLTTSTSAPTTFTTRNYRWTVSDFRTRANRLAPGGKEFSCLDASVLSDAFLLYNLGYITYEQLIGEEEIPSMQDYMSGAARGVSGQSMGISGVCFTSDSIYASGLCKPLDTTPLVDFVGYTEKCLTPTDFFNRAWFVPMIPGMYTAPCSAGIVPTSGGTWSVSGGFYDRQFFADFPDFELSTTTLDISGYACTSGADGFYVISDSNQCRTCHTWYTSGSHNFNSVNGYGFLYKNNNSAPWLFRDESAFYNNSFPISECGKPSITGIQSTFLDFGCVLTSYKEYDKQIDVAWDFRLPNASLDNPYFDTLSFGLPAEYIKPSNMTYSFYISRDGVGLDQLFYGRKRNTFIERWKFPAVDAVIDALEYNSQNPYTVSNDGTGKYIPLIDYDLFKYGTLSVGEFTYPAVEVENLDNGVEYENPLNSILPTFSGAQANFGSAVGSFSYSVSGSSITCAPSGCAISGANFAGLYDWFNTPIPERTVAEKQISHYYPMTYDNFTGPTSGGQYFLPRGPLHQSQFSLIPAANSSSIRDRAALWPWCDLLAGKATNKPTLGSATWNWDNDGNIWVAECTNIETITPTACFDPEKNVDPLHRKITQTIINEDYLSSYDRETYVIRMFNKKSELQLEYTISYDESAGPEIIGSKEGFEYNAFGTSLIPRTIDLTNYNNKPLNGPSQFWVEDFDESNSIQARNWRKTELIGTSGVPEVLYPYRRSTVCEMISGGYQVYNVENPVGYLCEIGGDEDVWIYSAPTGESGLIELDSNFYIAASPFALGAVISGGPSGLQPVYANPSFSCTVAGVTGQNCGFGSEIVRSVSFSTGTSSVTGACVSTAYITGPESFGLGNFGLGKSQAYGRRLLWNGASTACVYSSNLAQSNNIPSDEVLRTSWPWNVLAFDGLIGPRGFTDAIDADGNYWMAIGDNLNTNPYAGNVTFSTGNFTNKYTIIKILAANKAAFLKTILARTNILDINRNYMPIKCLSEVVDATTAGYLNGARYREGIIEALNMPEGQRYYDLYVKIIQENAVDKTENSDVNSKTTFSETTSGSGGTIVITNSFALPLPPLVSVPEVNVVQRLDIASAFDIKCIDCNICDQQFQIDSPNASPWFQHNHDEWIAPFMDSPFAGPYNKSGFNVWLTVGNNPRWGTPLWSDAREGKVWINYRRQRFHVNEYRNQLVLATITSAVAIEDFETTVDTTGISGVSASQIPVFVNYDEFLYCLEDYKNTAVVQDILNKQTQNTSNGIDCTDNIIASVSDNFYTLPSLETYCISGGSVITLGTSGACSAATSAGSYRDVITNMVDFINLAETCSTTPCVTGSLCSQTWYINGSSNEAYVEWATSFIQELKSTAPNNCDVNKKKYYIKYSPLSTYDSNTFVEPPCVDAASKTPYDWRRYQDGVGLGGDAPAFNLYDDGREFTCNRLSQWFIGQTAFGSPDKAVIVGGFAIAGDGELRKSHCWWESPTFGTTFKWNPNVIQPEDTLNKNYAKRALSPFYTNGQNSMATSSLGVVILDVSGSTKIERQGTVDFVGVKEYKVVFSEPIPDYMTNPTNYSISMVPSDNVKLYWSDKTPDGFTIKSEIEFSGSVDWSIFMIDPLPTSVVDTNFNDEIDVFSTKLDNL
jgi:hypothetical protein